MVPLLFGKGIDTPAQPSEAFSSALTLSPKGSPSLIHTLEEAQIKELQPSLPTGCPTNVPSCTLILQGKANISGFAIQQNAICLNQHQEWLSRCGEGFFLSWLINA